MTTKDEAVGLVDAALDAAKNWQYRKTSGSFLEEDADRLDTARTALLSAIQALTKSERQARAELRARSKSMLRIRRALINVRDELEDEGDRVYFGSTNHADQFRDAVNDLDGWAWHDIVKDGEGEDIYATCREQVARAETAEASLTTAQADLATAEAAITELRKQVEARDEALRPFAAWPVADSEQDTYQVTGRIGDEGRFVVLTIADFRRARAIVEGK